MWYETLLAKGKFTFFVTHNATLLNLTYKNIPKTLTIRESSDVILVALSFFMTLIYELQSAFTFTALGICAITIWSGANNFVDGIKKRDSFYEENGTVMDFDKLSAQFHQLMKLADGVNNVFSTLCLWTVIEATIWLSTDLDAALTLDNYYSKVYDWYLLLYILAAFVMSADSVRKVENMLLW